MAPKSKQMLEFHPQKLRDALAFISLLATDDVKIIDMSGFLLSTPLFLRHRQMGSDVLLELILLQNASKSKRINKYSCWKIVFIENK
jgi:hypothetical protein